MKDTYIEVSMNSEATGACFGESHRHETLVHKLKSRADVTSRSIDDLPELARVFRRTSTSPTGSSVKVGRTSDGSSQWQRMCAAAGT